MIHKHNTQAKQICAAPAAVGTAVLSALPGRGPRKGSLPTHTSPRPPVLGNRVSR